MFDGAGEVVGGCLPFRFDDYREVSKDVVCCVVGDAGDHEVTATMTANATIAQNAAAAASATKKPRAKLVDSRYSSVLFTATSRLVVLEVTLFRACYL